MLGNEETVEHEKEFSSYKLEDNRVQEGVFLAGADGVERGVRKQLQPNCELLDPEQFCSTLRKILDGACFDSLVFRRSHGVNALIEIRTWRLRKKGNSLVQVDGEEGGLEECSPNDENTGRLSESWSFDDVLILRRIGVSAVDLELVAPCDG
ncbi:uncharacterized protein BCR38DRAFT_412288 [Pseudomassariella vexata]|uniref:Uncharacterized protein n=1 Tax=Pseudomassariella vexata TaxID=1141098 RepID=A0A1Y2DLG4_9PEZI|nr:uncharacterized protein BCR38DRAFT_412288 [Pseudomassariella vexata]ORY60087.1 hypothetical protein BCR38DRAFT_412288 [Pseudomassariella vexata]